MSETMKAVKMVEDFDLQSGRPGKVGIVEVSKPKIVNNDDVMIKIAYSSICGSDPHILHGAYPEARAPRSMEHELAGTVVELGTKANAKGLKIGDRVTGDFSYPCHACEYCQAGLPQFCLHRFRNGSGQSEYIVWREGQVYRVDDSLSLKQAALAEPFNIAFHAVEMADIKFGSSIVILGAGGIGLLAVAAAKRCGAVKITVVEPVETKRRLAIELGADYAIDPASSNMMEQIKEITKGFGFNAVLETSGNIRSAESSFSYAAKQGHIVYMAMYKVDYNLPVNMFRQFYQNEIRLQGMFLAQGSFRRSLAVLATLNLEKVISRLYKLDECVQAYEDQVSGKYAKLMFEIAPDK
jgi:(R,R)-butanediol dehydrogenase/meso-butanediol dehydrogenase/diacetyl reductase/L-iditol 2-dehydrogenase